MVVPNTNPVPITPDVDTRAFVVRHHDHPGTQPALGATSPSFVVTAAEHGHP